MSEERTVRIDKWLWSIRAYKTRSLAADACKGNKITVGGMSVKPSREVKEGDTRVFHSILTRGGSSLNREISCVSAEYIYSRKLIIHKDSSG